MRLEFRWRTGALVHGTRTDRAVLGVFSHIGPTLTLIEALVCVSEPYTPGGQQHVRIGQITYPLGARPYTASELEEEVRRLLLDLLRRGEEACRLPAADPEFAPSLCQPESDWLKTRLGLPAVVEQTGPSQYRAYIQGTTEGRVEGRFSARDACTRLLASLNLLFVGPQTDLGPRLGSTRALPCDYIAELRAESQKLG